MVNELEFCAQKYSFTLKRSLSCYKATADLESDGDRWQLKVHPMNLDVVRASFNAWAVPLASDRYRAGCNDREHEKLSLDVLDNEQPGRKFALMVLKTAD
ncbi:MAG: hypothetical protein AAGL08_20070 [Cyanobacteria bacterium J06573_11]